MIVFVILISAYSFWLDISHFESKFQMKIPEMDIVWKSHDVINILQARMKILQILDSCEVEEEVLENDGEEMIDMWSKEIVVISNGLWYDTVKSADYDRSPGSHDRSIGNDFRIFLKSSACGSGHENS